MGERHFAPTELGIISSFGAINISLLMERGRQDRVMIVVPMLLILVGGALIV